MMIPLPMEQRPSSVSDKPFRTPGFTNIGGSASRLNDNDTSDFLRNLLDNGKIKKEEKLMHMSIVGDVDMIRVRDAERLILQEEEIYGRYQRDDNGNLVPA